MIGKPEWFTRRKWAGWGIFPATWQGWIYMVVLLCLIFGSQLIPADQGVKIVALGIIAMLLVVDTIDIMVNIKKDERETLHEALSERNALWTIIFVLAAGVAYQAASSVMAKGQFTIDPVVIIAVISGLIVKAGTNFYLDKKN